MSHWKTQLTLLFFLVCASVLSHCSCLSTEFSILGHDSDEFTFKEQRVVELFEIWMEKHGKVYKDAEEMELRLERFAENLKYVMERRRMNSKSSTHEVGLNVFSDLSNEEFKEAYLSQIQRPIKHKKITELRRMEGNVVESCDAPSSLDWRKKGVVTGVKNQKQCGRENPNYVTNKKNNGDHDVQVLDEKMSTGVQGSSNSSSTDMKLVICLPSGPSVECFKLPDCWCCKTGGTPFSYGSCWAFSSTGAMEGINALVTGDLISLSEQELVDCDATCDGCGGGNMDSAFEWVINNGGIDTESGYPYKAKDGTCNITKEETKVVTIDGYADVAQEEKALLCAAANQPISVGIDGSAMDFQLYTGGIYDGECSPNPKNIDHAVLIVGYGSEDGQDYWIVKNSWGTNWGMEGYIYIKRNTDLEYGVCAINSMASYPTKTSGPPSPFPSPTIPPPPPPPPSPPCTPTRCADTSYCSCGETCCCIVELYGVCLVNGCCGYENAVCCANSVFCCPQDYPVCDIEEGLCLQSYGDIMGVAARKRKMAKHKFPWTKLEGTENPSEHLQWKRNQFAAAL